MLNTCIRRKYFEVSVSFLHVRMWELFAWNRVAIRVSNTLSNTCLLCYNYIVKGVGMCEVWGRNYLEFKVKTNFEGENFLFFNMFTGWVFSSHSIVSWKFCSTFGTLLGFVANLVIFVKTVELIFDMTSSIALTDLTKSKTSARKDLHDFKILRHDWMPPFCLINESHSFFFWIWIRNECTG
jgi:hypothetical protein